MAVRTAAARRQAAVAVCTAAARRQASVAAHTVAARRQAAVAVRTAAARRQAAVAARTAAARRPGAVAVHTAAARKQASVAARTAAARRQAAVAVRIAAAVLTAHYLGPGQAAMPHQEQRQADRRAAWAEKDPPPRQGPYRLPQWREFPLPCGRSAAGQIHHNLPRAWRWHPKTGHHQDRLWQYSARLLPDHPCDDRRTMPHRSCGPSG